MEQVKVFSSWVFETVERKVNEWLKANPGIEITRVIQSQGGHSPQGGSELAMSIFYKPRM